MTCYDYRHGIDGPNRNRWFTDLFIMGGSETMASPVNVFQPDGREREMIKSKGLN